MREAAEEAGVPGELVTILFTSVFDLEYWSYTTVVARAEEHFVPVMGDAESLELEWVAVEEVSSRDLHPGFASSWPGLRDRLIEMMS